MRRGRDETQGGTDASLLKEHSCNTPSPPLHNTHTHRHNHNPRMDPPPPEPHPTPHLKEDSKRPPLFVVLLSLCCRPEYPKQQKEPKPYNGKGGHDDDDHQHEDKPHR
jgi:hypothetical protein